MKTIPKILFFGLLGFVSVSNALEPSIYGAGDIESDSPYGLTRTEQTVLENKRTLQMLYNKMIEQQRKIDGLTTIIDGQNREILDLKEQLEIQAKTLESATASKADANRTFSLLMQLGKSIDYLNNTYISRDELRKILDEQRPPPPPPTVVSSAISRDDMLMDSSMQQNRMTDNLADVYRNGVQLFGRQNYDEAKAYFEQSIALNFKPAASNYYLGEIAYYTHNYQDAVSYYKLSASLYDSAGYMDVLYVHTAISLAKNGERDQARAFFQHVIDNYPNGKAAEIARKRI